MIHQPTRVRGAEVSPRPHVRPGPADLAPALCLCADAVDPTSARPPIRHLADGFVKCLDGTYGVPSTTYADGLLDQLTSHVDEHPEDTAPHSTLSYARSLRPP